MAKRRRCSTDMHFGVDMDTPTKTDSPQKWEVYTLDEPKEEEKPSSDKTGGTHTEKTSAGRKDDPSITTWLQYFSLEDIFLIDGPSWLYAYHRTSSADLITQEKTYLRRVMLRILTKLLLRALGTDKSWEFELEVPHIRRCLNRLESGKHNTQELILHTLVWLFPCPVALTLFFGKLFFDDEPTWKLREPFRHQAATLRIGLIKEHIESALHASSVINLLAPIERTRAPSLSLKDVETPIYSAFFRKDFNIHGIYDGIRQSYCHCLSFMDTDKDLNKWACAWAQLGILTLIRETFSGLLCDYMNLHTPKGADLVRTLSELGTGSHHMEVLIRSMSLVNELSQFPPGLLPICASYVYCETDCGFLEFYPYYQCGPREPVVNQELSPLERECVSNAYYFEQFPRLIKTTHDLANLAGAPHAVLTLLQRPSVQDSVLTRSRCSAAAATVAHLFLLEAVWRLGYLPKHPLHLSFEEARKTYLGPLDTLNGEREVRSLHLLVLLVVATPLLKRGIYKLQG